MFHKQTLWLTGSTIVFCGVLAWWSFRSQPAAGEAAQAIAPPAAEVTLVSTPVDDSQQDRAEKTSTSAKRKKKVTSERDNEVVQYNKLTPKEARVLLHKGTEPAFTGEYTDLKEPGTYICRRCNAPLYHSDSKFHSNCGWPSFDDEIKGAVTHRRETDGTGRVEIVCANCGGHLGHVFFGEGFTQKNTRHCVNSISMIFVAQGKPLPKVIKPKDKEAKDKDTKDQDAKDSTSSEKPSAERPGAKRAEDATKPGT